MAIKSTARSTENSKSDGFDYELDETVPLPTLPHWSRMSTMAANDASFADQAMNEKIERLLLLVESMDERLKTIAEAMTATNAQPSKRAPGKSVPPKNGRARSARPARPLVRNDHQPRAHSRSLSERLRLRLVYNLSKRPVSIARPRNHGVNLSGALLISACSSSSPRKRISSTSERFGENSPSNSPRKET